jgi:hypothetical protein
MMNVIAVLVLNLGINTWGKALFDLDTIPDIFGNSTESSCDPMSVTAASVLKNMTTPFVNVTSVDMTTPVLSG